MLLVPGKKMRDYQPISSQTECTQPFFCTRVSKTQVMCDIGYIIKDHVPALMQVLTNELREYNMQLITTKCLNTAVMMMYLLLGTKALQYTRHCDVENVRVRKSRGTDPQSGTIASMLRRHVNRCSPKRSLFYVMITNGDMQHATNKSIAKMSFPGHVFVIERIYRGVGMGCTFNIYQSYINQYSMAKYIDVQGGSLSIGKSKMQRLMLGIDGILNKAVWDKECTATWTELTSVDASRYEGFVIKNNLLMCYRTVETTNCVSQLNTLVEATIKKLKEVPHAHLSAVYGDPKLYKDCDQDVTPLTNAEMLTHMTAIRDMVV
jgi:hypothetical protein